MRYTSQELSIALREAGAPQDSKLVHCMTETGTLCEVHESDSKVPHVYELNGGSTASAFDCHELMEWFRCEGLFPRVFLGQNAIRVKLNRSEARCDAHCEDGPVDNLADALGKMKLWYLQTEHCKLYEGSV